MQETQNSTTSNVTSPVFKPYFVGQLSEVVIDSTKDFSINIPAFNVEDEG